MLEPAAVVGAIGLILPLLLWRHMTDFRVYRRAAQAVVGGVNVYTDNGYHLQFTYPPFASDFVVALAVPSLVTASILITVCTIAAALFVTRHALAGLAKRPWPLVPALTVALLWTEPLRITTWLGQINAILMALVVADVLGAFRRLPRGVLTGVAVGVKLTPGVFLLAALATRRWRAAAVGAFVFVLTVVLGAVVQPSAARQYWSDLLWQTGRVGHVQWYGNQSLLGMLTRFVGTGPATQVVWLAAGALTLGVGLSVASQLCREGEVVLAVGVVGVVSTLLSPISWTHHWVWCIPVFGGLAARAGHSSMRWALAMLWLIVFEVGPNTELAHVAFRSTPSRDLVGNDYVIAGLVLVVALALRPASSPRIDEAEGDAGPPIVHEEQVL